MLGATIGDTFYVVGIQRVSDSGAVEGAPKVVGAFSSEATARRAVIRAAQRLEKQEGLDYELVVVEMTVGADAQFDARVDRALED